MSLNRDTVGKVDLDEFVKAVSGIYINKDKVRSVWDVWLHANHHAAAIGEEVRKAKPGEKLLIEIADFAMWLFTFAGKIRGTFDIFVDDGSFNNRFEENTIRTKKGFSDIIWDKYPGICPVCFWHRSENGVGLSSPEFNKVCDCLIKEIENRDQSKKREHVEKLRRYAAEHIGERPANVDLWQAMFQKIFEANLRHVSLVDIGFHLLEEVGEVSNSMVRMYTYKTGRGGNFRKNEPKWRQVWLEEEIADVASWLFTLLNHLRFVPEIANAFQKYVFQGAKPIQFDEDIKLSRIIWNRYGNEGIGEFMCPHCKKQICRCPILLIQDRGKYRRMAEYMS